MSGLHAILRDVPLQGDARKLPRPVMQGDPVHADMRTLQADHSIGVASAESTEPVGDISSRGEKTARMSVAFERDVEQRTEQLRLAAYRKGLQDGAASLQQDLEHRATELAHGLAEARVRKMRDECERKAQDAIRESRHALDVQRERFVRLTSTLETQLERQLQMMEEPVLELAFAAVTRILGHAAVSQEGLRRFIEQALNDWRLQSPPHVHVHPDDYALLQSDGGLPKLLEGSGRGTGVCAGLVPDASVQLGGCILRSHEGALDARLEVQLQALKQIILKTRSARSEQPFELAPGGSL